MLRLVEHIPTWDIHALLRISDIAYKVDYSPLPTALGRTLPIIIDDEGIYQGQDIFDCIKRHCRHMKSSSEEDMDELVSGAIRQRFDHLWSSLLHISGHQRDQAIRASPFGLNFYLGHRFDLQSLFSMYRSFPGDADSHVEIIEDKLMHEYLQINRILEENPKNNSIIFNWPYMRENSSFSSDKEVIRHVSDAVLFGYIAKAMTYPSLAERISDLEYVMKFFFDIATKYFQNHDSTDKTGSWKVSLYRLLQNPYVGQNPDYERLVKLIVNNDEVHEYALLSYPPSSLKDVADEPSELVFPKIQSIQSWRDLNSIDSNTISMGGLALTTIVAASFVTFVVKSRLH